MRQARLGLILASLRVHRFRHDVVLWAISIAAVAGFAVTLDRIPISVSDGPFYASIARSVQLHNEGMPTILDQPDPFDHTKFYGPVFFRVVAVAFQLFGFSDRVFRAVSLLGALLIALGGLAMAAAFGGDRNRRAWVVVLLLLSPELGLTATLGRMDPLAVGLEILGLAVFTRGLARPGRPWLHGLGASTLFAAAALTTPRTYPFLLAVLVAIIAVLPHLSGDDSRSARRQAAIAVATFLAIGLGWTIVAVNGPLYWFRMMAYVATHEDTDVALIGPRFPIFTWWRAMTLAFVVPASLVAARQLRGWAPAQSAAAFALVAGWTTLVITFTVFNYMFVFGTYAVLPLFAVALAVPISPSVLTRRTLALAAVVALCAFGGLRAAKYARGAATWTGRDPEPLRAFIASHVPAGSTVVGMEQMYYFAVERAGSRYLTSDTVSWADWTRWIPAIEHRPPGAVRMPRGDFLVWPAPGERYYEFPSYLECARSHRVATFRPPPPDWPSLLMFSNDDHVVDYPESDLFRLSEACPPRAAETDEAPSY